jgi:GTP-binding protein Era
VERVLQAIESKLPEGPAGYDEETLTNAPTSFFVREYIREQVLLGAEREVPHAVAVSIDKIDQAEGRMLIQATLHVDKPGQRKILVGRGGTKIREIGTLARLRIEGLVGHKVRLELFVRVSPRWRDTARQLAELGYESAEQALTLPAEFEKTPPGRSGSS